MHNPGGASGSSCHQVESVVIVVDMGAFMLLGVVLSGSCNCKGGSKIVLSCELSDERLLGSEIVRAKLV